MRLEVPGRRPGPRIARPLQPTRPPARPGASCAYQPIASGSQVAMPGKVKSMTSATT